jgi:hypothetical protein
MYVYCKPDTACVWDTCRTRRIRSVPASLWSCKFTSTCCTFCISQSLPKVSPKLECSSSIGKTNKQTNKQTIEEKAMKV